MHDISTSCMIYLREKDRTPAALEAAFPGRGDWNVQGLCVPPRSLHHWPDAASAPRTTRWGLIDRDRSRRSAVRKDVRAGAVDRRIEVTLKDLVAIEQINTRAGIAVESRHGRSAAPALRNPSRSCGRRGVRERCLRSQDVAFHWEGARTRPIAP